MSTSFILSIVKELEIGEPEVVASDYSIDCTYNLLPTLQPRWLSPGGREISNGSINFTNMYIDEMGSYFVSVSEGSFNIGGVD